MEGFIAYTKTFALVLFFSFYCGVFIWTYWPRNREKMEEMRNIPFIED
ncbi:MAG: cbb3-type cytochrome c oxidase subunit 3 [Deltaproteobacteria bacterium]|nr:cbb3-type cytochrome c oxidase subunit 3 [Deltaproteobacteria bacterium]